MFKNNTTHSPLSQQLLSKATPTKQQITTSNRNLQFNSPRQLKIERQYESGINSFKLYLQILNVINYLLSILYFSRLAYRPISNFDSTYDSKKLDSSFEHQPLVMSRNTPPYKFNHQKNVRTLSPMDFKGLDQGAISPQLLNKINIAQQQNQEIQKEFRKEHQNCNNHQSKKAKYYIANDSQILLCSKCAISMVGRGYKVLELSDNDIRQTQINSFLLTINQLLPKFENAISSLTLKKEDILKYHESQKTKLNSFFNSINECINGIRVKLDKTLENNYQTINQVYNNSFNDLRKALNETLSMKKDIEQNFERILSQIENGPFLEIMSCYNENLSTFLKQIEYVQKKPLEIVKFSLGDQLFKVYPENISNVIQLIKTSLLKRNSQENNENDPMKTQSENLYMSFDNKDKIASNQEVSQNIKMKKELPFRQLFDENQLNLEKKDDEQVLEEGQSQMIEREDIENSYNMMLGSHESEQEDQIQQHNNGKLTFKLTGANLFCSPQFKDN